MPGFHVRRKRARVCGSPPALWPLKFVGESVAWMPRRAEEALPAKRVRREPLKIYDVDAVSRVAKEVPERVVRRSPRMLTATAEDSLKRTREDEPSKVVKRAPSKPVVAAARRSPRLVQPTSSPPEAEAGASPVARQKRRRRLENEAKAPVDASDDEEQTSIAKDEEDEDWAPPPTNKEESQDDGEDEEEEEWESPEPGRRDLSSRNRRQVQSPSRRRRRRWTAENQQQIAVETTTAAMEAKAADEDQEDAAVTAPVVVEEAKTEVVSSPQSKKKSDKPKKLTSRDAAMTSNRRLRRALVEPAYDVELVPRAKGDLEDSVFVRHEGNEAWEALLAEIVLLCNEAAWRRSVVDAHRGGGSADPKPLMLEYVSDRLDTDDPLWGYSLRTKREFWLQGFVCVTVFTTWTPYFRFTNEAPSAAVTAADLENHVVDDSLARDLDVQRRSGDPEGEGVVWPRVAEISLLGGLGGGRALLTLVLDQLRDSGNYDYVVLQATDQAIEFYERIGFAKIGAVASFEGTTFAPDDADGVARTTGAKLYWSRRLARHLLREIRIADTESVFAQPVDPAMAPGYEDIVKNPMDISTMRRRLVEGAQVARQAATYLLHDLEADFDLMISNCFKYNHATSILAAYARKLQRIGMKVFERAKQAHPQLFEPLSDEDLQRIENDEVAVEFEVAADLDKQTVMGYVHWTFPDQPVEDQYPSYLMAIRLRSDPAAHSLFRAADAALRAALGAADAAAKWAATTAECATSASELLPENSDDDEDAQKNGAPSEKLEEEEIVEETIDADAENEEVAGKSQRRILPTLEVGLIGRLTPDNAVPAPLRPHTKKRIIPRSNVTPRGRGFTSKLQRGPTVEYLGIFETAAEAQQAYDDALNDEDQPPPPPPQRKRRPPPTPDRFFRADAQEVKKLLERRSDRSKPLALRAATLASLGTTPEILREIADARMDELVEAQKDSSAACLNGARHVVPHQKRRALYNKVVTINDLPPCYPHEYWFVYQYVPDMEWCHVCPMERIGVFGGNSKRNGRPRWRLVPEGEAREIDVSAQRCTAVKHETVVKTQSADKEIFDIFESTT